MNADGPKGRATFSLSPRVLTRLEDAVPKSERSRFVEEAIDDALRQEARKALAAFLDNLPVSAGGDDSLDVLRRMRADWDGRPTSVLEGGNG